MCVVVRLQMSVCLVLSVCACVLVFADIGFTRDDADGHCTHLTPEFCFVVTICLAEVGHDCVGLVVWLTDGMTQITRVRRGLCHVSTEC